MIATAISSMCAVLGANGPAQDILHASDLFGWLVGAWDLEVMDLESEGMHRVNTGEWHFDWVLEGRAIQDVMIAPKLSQRTSSIPLRGNRYGTGLRVYDASTDRWRALWVNPVQAVIETLTVEKRGGKIVETGNGMRNIFHDIAADSFRYRIEKMHHSAWKTIADVAAQRPR